MYNTVLVIYNKNSNSGIITFVYGMKDLNYYQQTINYKQIEEKNYPM